MASDKRQLCLWPATGYEAHRWVRSGDEIASRRAMLQVRGDYQAAVPPLISAMPVVLSAETAALADDASQELVRFDAETGMIAAPFTSILLRSESASSSEMEHLTSSAQQVALTEIGQSVSVNAHLVVANVRAMTAAIALSDQLDENSIIAMHNALLRDTAPEYTGHWRNEQVWIGGGRISPHSATFVPPHHARVPELMADVVAFAGRTDVPVLIQAAIAHAQFESIHPFPDGNGRTGHALIQGMLRQPVVNTKTVASELSISEVAAQNAIDRLVDAEILTQSSTGRRNRMWQAPEILAALDAFGARARRRRG